MRASRPGSGRHDPPAGATTEGVTADGQSSFFSALFDFSFDRYVTTRIIKVLYARVLLELVMVAFRIARNTDTLVRHSAGPEGGADATPSGPGVPGPPSS